MRLDETGQKCPETLGEYYNLTKGIFGEDIGKRALDFFKAKIDESPNGKEEKVIAGDSQMWGLIFALINHDLKESME